MRVVLRLLRNVALTAMVLGAPAAAGLVLVTLVGSENHLRSALIWAVVAAAGGGLYRVVSRYRRRRVASAPTADGGSAGSLSFTHGEFRGTGPGLGGIGIGGGPQ